MAARFYTYENRAARRQREAEEWRTKARQLVFQSLARRQVEQAGIDPDTVSSLPVPITTDVSDVGEPIPPTRKEKKTGGSLFSRIKDVAGDVTETVFRGPVRKPWDVARPLVQAAEWEEEKIGRPTYRAAVMGLATPIIAATDDMNLKEAWAESGRRYEKGVAGGKRELAGGIMAAPTTILSLGGAGLLKTAALKTPAGARLAAKIPVLSSLFRSQGSRRAFVTVMSEYGGVTVPKGSEFAREAARVGVGRAPIGDTATILDRVNLIERVRFLDDNPARIVRVMKDQSSFISRGRNVLGRVLPDSFVNYIDRKGVRLLDTDAAYHVMDWKEGIGEFAQSLPSAYRHHMELTLKTAFPKGALKYKDGATRVLSLPGEPTLNDVFLNFKKYERMLTPHQRAALEVARQPWEVIEELSKRYGLPVKDWPEGFYAHRQVLTRTETITDAISFKEYEQVKKVVPVMKGGIGAKQATSIPRAVKSEAEGIKYGSTYFPWVDAQEIGMRQRLTEIFDQRLLNTYGKIEPASLAKVESATAKLAKFKQVEKELIAFKERPMKGVFSVRGLADDPEFRELLTLSNVMAGLSTKAARTDMADKMLAVVRTGMKETRAAAKGVKGELVAARRLREVGKAEIAELRGGTKSRTLRGIDATINRVNNEIRPIMANIDGSMAGIQALFALARQPLSYLKAFHFSTTSPAGLEALYSGMYKTGQLEEVIALGLKIYSRDDFGEFAVRGVAKIPVLGYPFAVSSRWFSRWGNSLRLLMAKSGTAQGAVQIPGFRGGVTTLQEGRDLMRGINLSTGYVPGDISTLETAMMFAPRWFRSQLSLTADAFTKGGRAGGEARKNLIALIATGSAFTFGMNKVLGNETKLDPNDPNWMRIRALGQDISVFGPWDTFVKGLVYGFSKGPEEGARYMVRSKASPAMGRVYDMLAGETFRGDKLSAESPYEVLASAAKLSTQWAPISVQAAFERGVPTTPPELGGAAVQFFGTKATPLTAYEKVTMERDDISQDRYGQDWAELEPYQKQDLLEANPDLGYRSQQAAWEERAELREYYTDNQEMLDKALELGEMTPEEWRRSYSDLRNREFGALEQWEERHPDEAEDLLREDSDDPNYRALGQYYQAFRDSRTPWGGLDSESLDIRMAELESSWTSSQSAFVERNTGIYGTPKVKEYKQDQKKLRPYWELQEEVWAKMQEAYPKLRPYRGLTDYMNAMAQEMNLSALAPEAIQQRVEQLPIVVYLRRVVKALRERHRLAHPAIDALLLKWGYTSTLIRQRTQYTARYGQLVGR